MLDTRGMRNYDTCYVTHVILFLRKMIQMVIYRVHRTHATNPSEKSVGGKESQAMHRILGYQFKHLL
jgi:hypothetical protein